MKTIKELFKFNKKKPVKSIPKSQEELEKEKFNLDQLQKKSSRNPSAILDVMDDCIEEVRKQIKNGSYFPQKQLQAYNNKTSKKYIGDAKMSFDNAITGITNNPLVLGMANFPGFSFLSQITQNPWIRKVARLRASAMTKEFGNVATNSKTDANTIVELEESIHKFKVKDRFRTATEYTGYFGGCKLYIDVRINGEYPSDEELLKPLFIEGNDKYNKSKIPADSLYGLKLVEPINCYPGTYNSSEPTKENFMIPDYWLVYGKAIHKSRFLHFVENEPVFTLKPVYQFYGISLSQLVLPYIVGFEENLKGMNTLVKRFSKTYIKTNMPASLAPNQISNADSPSNQTQSTENQFMNRGLRLANEWGNQDIVYFSLDEEVHNVQINLGGVNDIVESNLSFIAMIDGKSRTSFLGDTPSGLNSSGASELRRDQATTEEQRQALLTDPMARLLEILQLNLGKEIDQSITWEWGNVYAYSQEELIDMLRTETETGVQLIQNGVITPDELRDKISKNPKSGYNLLGNAPDFVDTSKTDVDNILVELDSKVNDN